MGIEDRDWYQEEQLKRLKKTRFLKKSSNRQKLLVMILFWVGLLFLLFQLAKHFQRLAPTFPFSPSSRQAATTPTSTVVPSPEVERSRPQAQRAEEVQPPAYREPVTQRKPEGVVTIYRCKAYAGGIFWSSAYCGTQQALIDRTATVPNGMPFEQQVQIAEAQRVEAAALYDQQPSPAVQIANRCAALKHERETIESRYSNWQWQPPEVINPDQTRMRGLRAEQARLGCPTQ